RARVHRLQKRPTRGRRHFKHLKITDNADLIAGATIGACHGSRKISEVRAFPSVPDLEHMRPDRDSITAPIAIGPAACRQTRLRSLARAKEKSPWFDPGSSRE